jgi:LacI family gluconate utilization system Gnt-I transcriptional repressor
MKKKPARKSSNRVTLQDVAQYIGVSAITISRALHKPDKVSDAMRRKVDAAVRELGYIPNRAASALASAESRIVSLIIPSLTNNVFSQVIRAVYDVLLPEGYQILLGNSHYSPLEEERLITTFLEQNSDGIIVTGLDQTTHGKRLLSQSGIPVVQIMEVGDDSIDMNVGFSHFQAAYDVTCHLIESGRRNIGFLGARMDPRAQRRLQGYQKALEDAGLSWRGKISTTHQPSSVKLGGQLLLDIVSTAEKLDGLFCLNDDLAMGALFECQRSHIRIPEDLAIAGFNDLEPSACVNPSLTTVSTPRYEMGQVAARKLLERMQGVDEPEGPRVIDLGYNVVVRQST